LAAANTNYVRNTIAAPGRLAEVDETELICDTVLLSRTEERRCRRLCNSGNSAGGSADITWSCDDCISYGLTATRSNPPGI